MKITAIEKQKNNTERYSIYIDDSFAFGLDAFDVLSFRLVQGQELDEESYTKIIKHSLFAKARDKALRLLGFKSRTEKEIFDKLLKEEYPKETIEEVIEFLKQYNYIDDESYAKAFAKEKFKLKGYGTKRLTYELGLKGIKAEVINKVISELMENEIIDENSMAVSLIRKKLKGENEIDDKLKQRVFGYLARRGYSFEVIKKAFNEVLQEDFEC